MPAEPASPIAAPTSTLSVIEALEHAVALVRAQLDALSDRRRRDTDLADGWQGGHRERFDGAVRELELRGRRVTEALALVTLASRRALDQPVSS